MKTTHEIRLEGRTLRGERIDAALFQNLFDTLVEGASDAVRLVGEGRSGRRRGKPGWLQRAAAFDFVPVIGKAKGRHVFKLDAQPLTTIDPVRFGQQALFDDIPDRGRKSGLDLFEDALEVALLGNKDSDLYDEGLLETCLSLRGVFAQGVERIEVENGRIVPIDAAGLDRIAALQRSTPPPQQARLAGHLDLLEGSRSRFVLVLADGTRVGGVAESVNDEELRVLWKRNVTVSGRAYFHPSGRVRRIEADRVTPSSEVDQRAFASAPVPLFASTEPRAFRVKQGPNDGLNAIFGQWPAEDDGLDADLAIAGMR